MVKIPLPWVLLTLVLSSLSAVTAFQPQETTQTSQIAMPGAESLSNDTVLEMLKAGLAPEIVVAKIKSSTCNFDTTPKTLQQLKAAGVPDTVILAMVEARVGPPAAIPVSPSSKETLPAREPEIVEVKVPDGTAVEVELKATVSSEDVQEGSVVDFTVVQPVRIDGFTVVESGAPAKARIEQVKKARHWGRSGQVFWAMQDLLAADGSRVPLRFSKETKGGGSSGMVAVGVVATSVLFWPAAPVWGLKKGHPAVLPAGKRFEVFVHGDWKVKVRKSLQPRSPDVTAEEEKPAP